MMNIQSFSRVQPHEDIVGELPEAKQPPAAEQKQPTSQNERKV